MSKADKPLTHIKTGAFSRRLNISMAGIRYGSRALSQNVRQRFSDDHEKAYEKRRENIEFLVKELGKLKGSVVKIGQIMATYGDYILPPEVVEALHSLEDDTPPLAWSAMEKVLKRELSEDILSELDIDEQPIAAASLGQVHRARHRESGEALCIKIQYPGVDKTIDADFNAVLTLLKVSRLLDSTKSAEDWFSDIRNLLRKEVDYEQEKRDLDFVARQLADDPRYVVPKSFDRYCTMRVLTMSYEEGVSINSKELTQLPQARRNALGRSLLDVFLQELFDWQRMQTDPNFGNYRIQIDEQGENDRIVLLDFGAMRLLAEPFASEFCNMMLAAQCRDKDAFIRYSINLGFMNANFPDKVLENFASIGMDIGEPLRAIDDTVPPQAINADGIYDWRRSDLPKRIVKRAVSASISKYFALPPKDFLYVMRKLMGLYAMIALLDAQFNGDESMQRYLREPQKKPV